MPPLALAITTGTITVINGTFTFALTIFRLLEVDEDLKICLQLLTIATRDLNYARQLRTAKFGPKEKEAQKAEFEYIESVIDDMDKATLLLGRLVQVYWVDHEVNNSISVPHRFKWVFKGKDRFAAQQYIFTAAHNSLLSRIESMEKLAEPASDFLAPPAYTEAILSSEEPILRSPSQQRRLEGKSSMVSRVENWPERVLSTKVVAAKGDINHEAAPAI